ARPRGFRHNLFDFNGVAGQAFAQQLMAGFGDEDVVFDAHSEILFGDVDAGLDGDDHAGLERGAEFARIVDVQTDVMAEAVNEIWPEGFAVKIFSMGIDVVVGNLVNALVALVTEIHARLERGEGRVLRTENDVVDFALARRVLAVSGQRARDVCRIAGVLRSEIHARLERGEGRVLRTENDVVDFALARRVLAVSGQRARDVCRIAGVL